MANLRNVVLGTMLLSTALGAGCSDLRFISPYSYRDIKNPKYENAIRLSDDSYPIHYTLSQSEGEKQLGGLAKRAIKEDAWVYRVRNGKGEWIDVGRDTRVEITEKYTRANAFVGETDVKRLLDEGDAATFYHIHPNLGRTERSEREIYDDLPSDGDWTTHRWLKELCKEKGVMMNPSKVFGTYLMSTYDTDFSCQKSDKDIETEINDLLEKHLDDIEMQQLIQKLERLEAALDRLGKEEMKKEISAAISDEKKKGYTSGNPTLKQGLEIFENKLGKYGYKLAVDVNNAGDAKDDAKR